MTAHSRAAGTPEGAQASPALLLQRLSAELSQIQDTDLILESVLRHGRDLFASDAAAIVVLGPTGEPSERRTAGLPDESREDVLEACSAIVASGAVHAGWDAQAVQALSPVGGDAWARLAAAGFRACRALPLARRGSLAGAIFFLHHAPPAEVPEGLDGSAVLAGLACLALENVHLFEGALRQAIELGAFYETVTATVEGREAGPLLEGILAQACRLLEGEAGCILMVDQAGRRLRLVASCGLSEPPRADGVEVGYGVVGRVAETRSPLRVEDLRVHPDRHAQPQCLDALVRLLVVPLIWRAEVLLGVLVLGSSETRRPFSESDLRLAQVVAHQASNALGVSRLVEDEREQRILAEALHEAALSISRAEGRAAVLERILEQVTQAFECDAASLVGWERGLPRVIHAVGFERFGVSEQALENAPIALKGEAAYERLAQGGLLHVPDVQIEPDWSAAEAYQWARSWVSVPIRFGAETLGLLQVGKAQAGFFDGDMLARLEGFAAHAAAAMRNARLYQLLADEHAKLLEVYELGRRLSATLRVDEILDNLLAGGLLALSGAYACIYRLDGVPGSEDRVLARALAVGAEPEIPLRDSLAEDLAWKTVAARAPQQECHRYPGGGHWVSAAPLASGGRVWGVALVWSLQETEGDPPPLWPLAAAAQQAGMALMNAEQHQSVERRLAEMTLLQGVASATAQRLETAAVLGTVTAHLHQRLGYPAVQVYMRAGEEMVLQAVGGPRPVVDRISLQRGIVGRVARSGEPACVADVRQDPDYVAGLVGTQAEMAVPIRIGDDVLGVINIETSDPGQVRPENMDLLMALADQVSVALQNASLYEQVQANVELLNARVRERTAQLEAALEMAQSAERTKARFVADISHELRTPLTNIGLYLDLLEIGRAERRDEYMAILRHEAERLGVLIEQLLTISEFESGLPQLHREPTDLNALLRDLVGDRSRLIGSKGLRLAVEAAEGLPLLAADPQQLMQLMSNLLTNATNYTPSGGTIRIQTRRQFWRDRSWVTLTVADSGPGIPEEERTRVFERFYRGLAGRASGIPGTGLGLAICRAIAERHGGRLVLDGGPGPGTSVTAWFPEASSEGLASHRSAAHNVAQAE